MPLSKDQLAFCSWSVQPNCPKCLINACHEIGLKRLQLHLDPIHLDPERWGGTKQLLADEGIEIVSGMFTPLGEDYTTPQTIKQTGGLLPDATWEANLANFRKCCEIAGDMELEQVTFHVGFIDPEAEGKMVERLGTFADVLWDAARADLLLETGQETADSLNAFLDHVERESVGVNFDPANMLLYGMGDPIESLDKLLPHVRQVHLKDATPQPEPGVWGTEMAGGEGAVDWPAFFGLLSGAGFEGDLVIEREAGDDRIGDIRKAAANLPSHF
ncbi:MAG: sugar phosphate isomerase/epimerase family protein [Planctomycetota bacterium]